MCFSPWSQTVYLCNPDQETLWFYSLLASTPCCVSKTVPQNVPVFCTWMWESYMWILNTVLLLSCMKKPIYFSGAGLGFVDVSWKHLRCIKTPLFIIVPWFLSVIFRMLMVHCWFLVDKSSTASLFLYNREVNLAILLFHTSSNTPEGDLPSRKVVREITILCFF